LKIENDFYSEKLRIRNGNILKIQGMRF